MGSMGISVLVARRFAELQRMSLRGLEANLGESLSTLFYRVIHQNVLRDPRVYGWELVLL